MMARHGKGRWRVFLGGITIGLAIFAGGCRSNVAGLARPDGAVGPDRQAVDAGPRAPVDPDDPVPGAPSTPDAAAQSDAGPTVPPVGPAPAPEPPAPPPSMPSLPGPDAAVALDTAAAADAEATRPDPAPPATCAVGQIVCLGRMPQICGADGKWVNGALCPYACQNGCVNKFSAVSAGRGAPTNGEGVAEFARNAMTFYSERGGLFGARGFNVVILDPASGATIEPVKNFDPWDSPLTGNALKALASNLDAIEPGRLVMIATCDDPGIAKVNSCDKGDGEPVKIAIAALQRLGSTMIGDLCYRGAWSFAAITGQGRALAEKVSTGSKIAAEIVLPAAP